MRFAQSRALYPAILIVVVGLVALVVVLLPPRSGEVTFQVMQQFTVSATYDATPRTLVEVINGAGVYDTGEGVMVQYDWKTCDDCGGSMWADHGMAMYNANVAAQNAFRQDACYRVVVSKYIGDDGLGHSVALFSPENNTPKKIRCP